MTFDYDKSTKWPENDTGVLREVVEEREARVDAGARYFDATLPEWFNIVDLEALDLSACAMCMAGQLASHVDADVDPGGYSDSLEVLGIHSYARADELGLDVVPGDSDYEALTRLWRQEIERRRAQAELPT